MRVKILGSAAAEGIPAMWCECDVCRAAFKNGGKDVRYRCSYLIDDDTIVDLGPDSFTQMLKYHIDSVNLNRVIFTHVHEDHLTRVDLRWRQLKGWFSKVTRNIDIIGSKSIFSEIAKYAFDNNCCSFAELGINPVIAAKPGDWVKSGDMELLSLEAMHAAGKDPRLWVIRRNGKAILIANDTGGLTDGDWRFLLGVKIDAAIIDCTYGTRDGNHFHMGGKFVVEMRDRLVAENILRPDGLAVVNHFTHNAKATHADLEKYFCPKGFAVGYDGMEFEL